MAQKLNIGCGLDKRPGYVNIDFSENLHPDLVWDLEHTPWPFEDDAVDEIVAFHVLEHNQYQLLILKRPIPHQLWYQL